jgi:hypothetical protein
MAIASHGTGNGCLVERSSCLCVQFAGIEALSFLPNDQSHGSDLACQGGWPTRFSKLLTAPMQWVAGLIAAVC